MRQKKLDATMALAKEKDARAAFCHWWIPPGLFFGPLFRVDFVVKQSLCKS
jgi:hypothetical protein